MTTPPPPPRRSPRPVGARAPPRRGHEVPAARPEPGRRPAGRRTSLPTSTRSAWARRLQRLGRRRGWWRGRVGGVRLRVGRGNGWRDRIRRRRRGTRRLRQRGRRGRHGPTLGLLDAARNPAGTGTRQTRRRGRPRKAGPVNGGTSGSSYGVSSSWNVPSGPAGAGSSNPRPGTCLPGTPFTVSVEYANVSIANAIRSLLTSRACAS